MSYQLSHSSIFLISLMFLFSSFGLFIIGITMFFFGDYM